jgi:DNA-directed RNA polymerase subunit beta
MALNESSCEAFKLQKKEQEAEIKHEENENKIRIRLIPIWLRVIMIIGLIFVSMTLGAAIGYGVLGDGKASDVFKPSTWTHLIDLVQVEKEK